MPTGVNCQFIQANGLCLHAAAPRKLWGPPNCVLLVPPADARLQGCCSTQAPFTRPQVPAPIPFHPRSSHHA